jgi:N-acetylmuramic acid 6-phosphate etherase
MISTAAMVRTGHTFGNLMVDMVPRNKKLRDRSRRIVAQAAGCDAQAAEDTLARSGGDIKVAILVLLGDVDVAEARDRLAQANGVVRRALDALKLARSAS